MSDRSVLVPRLSRSYPHHTVHTAILEAVHTLGNLSPTENNSKLQRGFSLAKMCSCLYSLEAGLPRQSPVTKDCSNSQIISLSLKHDIAIVSRNGCGN